MRGKFIVLEGADGAGTTTQAINLYTLLTTCLGGESVVRTWEPSAGPIGTFIRGVLKNSDEPWPWREMSYLFMADRLHHVREEIEPALESGKHVICDRYYASTLVYQSASAETREGAEKRFSQLLDEMWRVNVKRGVDHPRVLEPHLWLYLAVDDVNVLAARRSGRGEQAEMYESDPFQQRVVEMYEHWHANASLNTPDRIDAAPSELSVLEDCWGRVSTLAEVEPSEASTAFSNFCSRRGTV